MTPTLIGRWQTRLLLLATVGVLITLPFALGIIGPGESSLFFYVLGYVTLFGLFWDFIYNLLQKLRWDRDWPGAFQLIAGIWEGVVIFCAVEIAGLPGIDRLAWRWEWFVIHYSCVWLGVYLVSQSLMRIIFPRWRFRGGKWF